MWRISAVDHEGREVGHFELVAGELTIGRDADRQMVLPSASVSRRHARVYLEGGQPCIVDEGSANGVIVDGVRITQPTYVNAGTRIDLAEFHLAVEPLAGGAGVASPVYAPPSFGMGMAHSGSFNPMASIGPLVPTGPLGRMSQINQIGVVPTGPLGRVSQMNQIGQGSVPNIVSSGMGSAFPGLRPSRPRTISQSMRLVAEGGPYDGRVFELSGADLTVGRAVDNDIVLDDPSLSRKHARIYRRGAAELEIEDLGSSNGSFINQRRVGRGAVHPGDTLRFGELSFRVEGDTQHGTSDVFAELPREQVIALGTAAAVTVILFLIMLVSLAHKPTPVQAPGRDAIARVMRQAEPHLREGRALFRRKK